MGTYRNPSPGMDHRLPYRLEGTPLVRKSKNSLTRFVANRFFVKEILDEYSAK